MSRSTYIYAVWGWELDQPLVVCTVKHEAIWCMKKHDAETKLDSATVLYRCRDAEYPAQWIRMGSLEELDA